MSVSDDSGPGEDFFEPVDDRADDDTDASDDNSDTGEICSPLTVGSARPVKGESFCDCYKTGKEKDCKCGEDDSCKNIFLSAYLSWHFIQRKWYWKLVHPYKYIPQC